MFLRPNPLRPGVYWHQARFDPLWAALQDLGVRRILWDNCARLYALE